MDEHKTDYSQITENIYIGSDLCRGPVCPVHSVQFQQLGINAEINLEGERQEVPTPGVECYLWLPVPDTQAPSPHQLRVGTAALNETIEIHNTVYVHCKYGHGRSPTLVAAYLIRYMKMGVEEAVALIGDKRPEVHLEETQMKALNEFAQLWK